MPGVSCALATITSWQHFNPVFAFLWDTSVEKWKVLRPLDRMGHGDGWPLLKERPGGCSALRGEFLDEENYENLLFAHSHFLFSRPVRSYYVYSTAA